MRSNGSPIDIWLRKSSDTSWADHPPVSVESMADARSHLALQTVLRASRDPVIDELHTIMAGQATTIAEQARELSQLRTAIAEQQDTMARLHASREEAWQSIDTCRGVINDMYYATHWILDFCRNPEQRILTNLQNRAREVLREIGWADVDEDDDATAGSDEEFHRLMQAAWHDQERIVRQMRDLQRASRMDVSQAES